MADDWHVAGGKWKQGLQTHGKDLDEGNHIYLSKACISHAGKCVACDGVSDLARGPQPWCWASGATGLRHMAAPHWEQSRRLDALYDNASQSPTFACVGHSRIVR